MDNGLLATINGEGAVTHRHTTTAQPSILTEAASLIAGDRHDSYGDYKDEAALIATGWEALRRGGPITPRHVPLMMTWLKMVRESHAPKRDNRVDIAGYVALLDQLYEK